MKVGQKWVACCLILKRCHRYDFNKAMTAILLCVSTVQRTRATYSRSDLVGLWYLIPKIQDLERPQPCHDNPQLNLHQIQGCHLIQPQTITGGIGALRKNLPLVLPRIRPNNRSVNTRPSSNLSTSSLMERNLSSGLRTRVKAFNNVSEILSMMPCPCSFPGGCATCWCIWTC